MLNVSAVEKSVISHLHLRGRGIVVIAHAPQQTGGCHPFEFLRGVLPGETYEQAFQRAGKDVLGFIARECGRVCACNHGEPAIEYRKFGK